MVVLQVWEGGGKKCARGTATSLRSRGECALCALGAWCGLCALLDDGPAVESERGVRADVASAAAAIERKCHIYTCAGRGDFSLCSSTVDRKRQ